MIAFAALAGTMVATKTVPLPAAATVPGEDTFPAALQGIAQARMGTAQPLAHDAKATQSAASQSMTGSAARSSTTALGQVDAENQAVATSPENKESPVASLATEWEPLPASARAHLAGDPPHPSPGATFHDQETNAQGDSASSATSSLSTTSATTATIPAAAAISAPQTTAAALAPECPATLPVKADTEPAKRTMIKAQVSVSGGAHPAKIDRHKMMASGIGHTETAAYLSPPNDAANSTVLSGGHSETGQPTPGAPQTLGELGSIPPPSISANAAATRTTQQHGHATPTKVVSAYTSPVAGSNPENGVGEATVTAPAATSVGESVAKTQPDGPSFKAELSMATQESGHMLSLSTGTPLNPLSNPHSAGAGPKPSDLAEMGGDGTTSGAAAYPGSLSHESHGTLVATPTTLEVGVPRGAEGWLKIRAEVGSDGISASLSTASHAGQSILRDQLPAINAFLQGEQIHASATVLDKGIQSNAGDSGSSAGMDRGLGQEGRAQSEQRQLPQAQEEAPEFAEDSHTVSPFAGVGVLLPAGSARGGASLSVLA